METEILERSSSFQVTYNNNRYPALAGETVLDCLVRNKVNISHSCRSGICQSCLLQLRAGSPTPKSQKGLDSGQIQQGLVFSCQQLVQEDLELAAANAFQYESPGTILERTFLAPDVVQISIRPEGPFSWQAGQFLHLVRADGIGRPYSICNPMENADSVVKLQVRLIPEGILSTWLGREDDDKLLGTKVTLKGPVGKCYYRPEFQDKDLFMAGTGTGLAPLYGILQMAFKQGHQGQIYLLHGGLAPESLYLIDELRNWEKKFPQFHYHPCVLNNAEEKEGFISGNLLEVVKNWPIDCKNAVAYLCGDPLLVNKMKQTIFLRGLSSQLIFSDPFFGRSSAT